MTKEERIAKAVDNEIARFKVTQRRYNEAAERGQISEHDAAEQIARKKQNLANRIAWIAGEPRPKPRRHQPLDNPEAFQPPA